MTLAKIGLEIHGYIDTKEKNAAELFNDLIANPLGRSCYNNEKNLFIFNKGNIINEYFKRMIFRIKSRVG